MRRKLAVSGNLTEFFFVAPVGENDDDIWTKRFKLLSAENLIISVKAESEVVVVDGQFLIFFGIKRRQKSNNFCVGGLVRMSNFPNIFGKRFGCHDDNRD